MNQRWMAFPLALGLIAAAGCMGHKEMSDTGMMDPSMEKSGMSDEGMMDKGMMDKDKGMMMDDGSEGGM